MRKLISCAGVLLCVLACVWITFQSNEVGAEAETLNRIFLILMLLLVGIAWMGGLKKMASIIRGFDRGLEKLTDLEKKGLHDLKSLHFDQKYLDDRYAEYRKYVNSHGDTDIREFINEYDIGTYSWKKFLEIVPDILTSAGILGTFIGLVVGLREFDPSGYQQMSSSMAPLIDGIKVAFLTSIYGIAISLAYSFRLSDITERLEAAMEEFLEKYYFLDKKKKEPFGELLAGQKEQTNILLELTETFTTQLADRFKEVITPTFVKLGNEIDQMADNQKKIMREAANEFADQFQKMFLEGMSEFEENLKRIGELQVQYMNYLDISSEKMSSSVKEQQDFLKESVREMSRYFQESAEAINKNIQIINKNIQIQREAVDYHAGVTREVGQNMIASGTELSSQTEALKKSVQNAAVALNESIRLVDEAFGEMKTSSGKIQKSMDATYLAASKITEEAERFADVMSKSADFHVPYEKDYMQSMSMVDSDAGEERMLLEDLLNQMKVLVELEKERQNRGLWKKLFRHSR